MAPFEWKGHKINLIDTPGYADFIGDVHAALRVADLAVFVVSAVEGVEVQAEAIWRLAAELDIPRMVFINKLDRERADFERTLDQLRDRFGAGVAPLELPIGREAEFRGVADLLTDTAWFYEGGTGTHGDVPDDMEELEHQVHDNLVEGIVVADDDLLERYLEGDVPSFEQLEQTLAHGVDEASVFPVVCGSATARVAVDRLADFICEIGPSPLDRPPVTVEAGRHHRRGRTRSRRPAARLRVQDGRRPVRRPHLAVQGAVGHGAGRRPPREQPLRHRRAAPRPVHGAGPRAGAGERRGGRRHRRRGEARRAPSPATRSPRRARR